MSALAILLISSAVANGASVAPPHAPNICSGTLCLEVMPALHPQHHLVRPSVRTNSEGETSRIDLEFLGLGTVIVRDVPAGNLTEFSSSTNIRICAIDRQCRSISLSVEGALSDIDSERLKCQVRNMWMIDPGGFLIVRKMVAVPYQQRVSLRLDEHGKCGRAHS